MSSCLLRLLFEPAFQDTIRRELGDDGVFIADKIVERFHATTDRALIWFLGIVRRGK